jgi:hypothetical protein
MRIGEQGSTSVAGISIVSLEEGLTVSSVTTSEVENSVSSSLKRPPNWTGTCPGAMYLCHINDGKTHVRTE